MNPNPRSFFKRWLSRIGGGIGLLWGVAIALLSDSSFPYQLLLDLGLRAVVVVTMVLLGAGLGRLGGWAMDAVRNRFKRP